MFFLENALPSSKNVENFYNCAKSRGENEFAALEVAQYAAGKIGEKLQELSKSLEENVENYINFYKKDDGSYQKMTAGSFLVFDKIRENGKENDLVTFVKKTAGYKQIHEASKQLDKKVELDFKNMDACREGINFSERRLVLLIDTDRPYTESPDAGILKSKRPLLQKLLFK